MVLSTNRFHDEVPLIGLADFPPAIRAVDHLHDDAVVRGASDIHVEPCEAGGRVRQRIHGILRHSTEFPVDLFAQIVSRIKLLAGMDIAERRQPQDGRYQLNIRAQSIDARVSSMPTISGEKLVIRLLNLHGSVPTLEDLGFPAPVLERYRELLHAPHGFIVVCGPTGSGKTTTLYASLGERNVEEQHLCTVEDPVEVRLPGVAQVQVHPKAGLTFASTLRSFLRQDPNVIMVGEMRDSETASVAISAALAGQLVVTSLHASDATRALDRLLELGMTRRSIAAGLSGVLAQRLVRTLCQSCKRPRTIVPREAALIDRADLRVVHDALGCDRCEGSGYSGRTAIVEFLAVTPSIQAAIAGGASSSDVAQCAVQSHYRPMIAHGIQRLANGETSVEELQRVLIVGGSA